MGRIMRGKLRGIEDKSKYSIIQQVAVPEGTKRENGGGGNDRKG